MEHCSFDVWYSLGLTETIHPEESSPLPDLSFLEIVFDKVNYR